MQLGQQGDGNQERAVAERQRMLEAEMQLSSIMRNVLEGKARERLNNVRLVNRELYYKVTQAVMVLAQRGEINGKLGDAELKDLLERLARKRETTIKRK
ncbi:MAG: DNA-binding protein [Candidatus Diapherotrites archaeon]